MKSFTRKACRGLIALAILLFTFVSSFSQRLPKPPEVKPPEVSAIKDSIVSIVNLSSKSDTARINDIIAISVKSSKPMLAFNTLYVNGQKVNGLEKINQDDKTINFYLNKTVQQKLQKYLGNKTLDNAVIPVYISVGNAKAPLTPSYDPIYLEVKHEISIGWFVAIGILLLILVVKSLANNILRDDNNLYYSLGRVQLFYWTVLFIICYLVICFQTDSLPDIPGSILAIIGISVATTAASKVIENNNKEKVPVDTHAKSEGLILDILSDGTSINIQRFQSVAFNIVFGIIIIQKTFSNYVLPDFDDNVLMMLGISSGAYAGLKSTEAVKEQNKPAQQVVSDPTPASSPDAGGAENAS